MEGKRSPRHPCAHCLPQNSLTELIVIKKYLISEYQFGNNKLFSLLSEEKTGEFGENLHNMDFRTYQKHNAHLNVWAPADWPNHVLKY